MSIKKIFAQGILLLVFSCGCASLCAQNRSKIDSLNSVVTSKRADSLRVNALLGLSLEFRQLGKGDSSRIYAEQSLALAVKIGFKTGEGRSLYYLGIVSSIRGDYEDANAKFSQAAEIFKALNDKNRYSTMLTAIGGVKNVLGDPAGAIDYHLQALRIKQEIGDSLSMASTMTNIGNVYASLEQYDTALYYFRSAEVIHTKYGEAYKLTDDYYNIGNMYHQLENDSLAMVYLNRSIYFSDSLGYTEALSYTYGVVAAIYFAGQNYDSSEVYYDKALQVATELDDQRMMSVHYLNLGNLYSETHQRKRAEETYQEALDIAVEIGDVENRREIYLAMSNHYERYGDYPKALSNYKLYVAYRDSIIDVDKQTEITRKTMNFKFESEKAVKKAEQDRIDAVNAADKQQQTFIIVLVSVILGLVVVAALFLYNRIVVTRRQNVTIQQQKEEVELQRDRVEQQKMVIEEKNKDITDSINYAQRIQQAVLPDEVTMQNTMGEHFVLFLPKDIVSGDFFWVAESADYFFCATADCTGHGVPGGFMSMLGASLLNDIVVERKNYEPGDILDLMRMKIILSLKQKGESGENKDGMDMVLYRIDRKRSELVYAAANNPLWLVRSGELIEYPADKQPVGIGIVNPQQFTQHRIPLVPGDVVYSFTDGYADQFGGPKGKKFRYKPLREMLVQNAGLSMEQQSMELRRTFMNWKGNNEQVDDVLLIGIRI